MEPFITQLRKLCADHPTRTKWVFVPSHATGHTIGDRLVLEGTNWANLRFVTPVDIALRMGAPFLVERGIDPSEEGLGPALMMRLLLALPEEDGYFRPLADQPQMAVALWSTIRELRLAGVTSAALRPDAFASAAKHVELAALLGAYETFLRAYSRGDQATIYEEAAFHADWCPIQSNDCWIEMPDVFWSPLQRRFLDALPGERLTPLALALPGVTLPRRLRTGNVERVAPRTDATLAFLTDPHKYTPKPASPRPPITLFHAGGAEAEVEVVFSRILASGKSLDQAEIVCAAPQYATLLWEKAIRYEWPVTVAQGIPAAMTRPGRALLSMIEWVEDDFAAGRLRRMLQSGDVRM